MAPSLCGQPVVLVRERATCLEWSVPSDPFYCTRTLAFTSDCPSNVYLCRTRLKGRVLPPHLWPSQNQPVKSNSSSSWPTDVVCRLADTSNSEWLSYGDEDEVMSDPTEGDGEVRAAIAGEVKPYELSLPDISLHVGLYMAPAMDE